MSGAPELYRLADACILPSFAGHTAPDWIRRRLAGGLAGVILFGFNVRDAEQLAGLTAALRAENPDALVAIDEEGGDVTRLEVATGSSYPGNLALGVVDDVELTRRTARSIGAELAEVGVNLNLAPDADVNSNPDNPVIGVRSFGAEAKLVAAHTAAFVAGLQSRRVAACAKHFPGHGDTLVDSHHGFPTVHADLAELEAGPLLPFCAAIEAGVAAVMTAHLRVPAYDDVPATVSRRILTGLLRDELGFDGPIVTDALDMQGVKGLYGIPESGVRALAAGADALLGGPEVTEENTEELRQAVVAAVTEGRLSPDRLAEAAYRVRRLAAWARTGTVTGTVTGTRTGTGTGTSAGAGTGRAGQPLGDPDGPADRSVGLAAARRAVRSSGVNALPAPAYVVELVPPATMAVGNATAWGIGGPLAALMPGTEVVRVGGAPQHPSALLAAAAGRPLVVVGRDAHRHPWIEQTQTALLAARPDTVVVEMGLPYRLPAGAATLVTHGAARVCAVAAAEILAGKTAVAGQDGREDSAHAAG